MTNERRHEAIVLALVFSVAIHVGLMMFIRPRVMTSVSAYINPEREARTMQGTRRELPSNPIPVMDIEDIEAKKAAPDMENSIETIAIATLENVTSLAADIKNPAPEILAESHIEMLSDEISRFEESKIRLDNVVSGKVAAMPIDTPEIFDTPAAFVEATNDKMADLTVPDFFDPLMPPVAAGFDTAPASAFDTLDNAIAQIDFIPSDEIYKEVDEKIIEAEKSAIRDLMDKAEVAEALNPNVNFAMAKQSFQEWTYFKVSIFPKENLLPVVPKDYVILLDVSNSIEEGRLESCREATKQLLRLCSNKGDRFNIVAFSNKYRYFSNTWTQGDEEGIKKADQWIDKLAVFGRTDVFGSISSVLTLPRDPTRPLIAMVVTDGEANAGVSETSKILSQFTSLNDGMISVYMYGVKGTANKELIGVLTHGNRGDSHIHQGGRLEAGKGMVGLAGQFKDPVLTDIRINFADKDVQGEVFPKRLKNLYRGEKVTLIGRFKRGSADEVAFSIKGLNGSRPYESYVRLPLNKAGNDLQLKRQWDEEAKIDRKLN